MCRRVSAMMGNSRARGRHVNIQPARTWGNHFVISCLTSATVASFDMSMVIGRPFATEGGPDAGDMVKDTMLVSTFTRQSAKLNKTYLNRP